MKLNTRQQAILFVLIYALIMFIAFSIYKTLLYVFVFSLVSILIVNFLLRNLLKIKIPYALAIILSLVIYFSVLVYAFINIIPAVTNQLTSFYDFMQQMLDSKHWEDYLSSNPSLSEVVSNIIEWVKPKIGELFNNLVMSFAKGLPNALVVIFYSVLFTVYVTIYTKWTTSSMPALFPKRVRPIIQDFLTKLGVALASYVDVMLLGSIIVSLSFYVLFSFYLPNYAILLAFWGFVTNFIPIVGVVIEWIPILIVTLGLGLKNFLIVNGIVMSIHLGAFLFFIFVMKKKANINPVLMLIFIFIIGLAYGMVGTFFAVPVAIFFVTLWNEFIKSELDNIS
ncbi:MAG TPA: AI-2E family transporter [Fervidobacterium sp.]|nr:AI-2E family transporter [Fervidobacterium sp.]HPT53318.1 AI-2E family transporter [Fervidobacterium sp.]HPZ16930.1 AI-2E family transporter [Fervidobacterium sp.]HQE47757.1 AI-2E family transporter [Fervidobacterium sp.]HUM41352.1 AI-2E family transporter [Fervidobacterium sp.]